MVSIRNSMKEIVYDCSTGKISKLSGPDVTNTALQLILIAVLVPLAVNYIFTANTSGWDSTTATLFKLIGTLAVIGFAVAAAKGMLGKTK
jgi:hypothetical protein